MLNKHNASDSNCVSKKNLFTMVTMIYKISSNDTLREHHSTIHVTESPTKGVIYEPQNESVMINSVDIPSMKTSMKDYTTNFQMGNVEIKLKDPNPIHPIHATINKQIIPVIINEGPIS